MGSVKHNDLHTRSGSGGGAARGAGNCTILLWLLGVPMSLILILFLLGVGR